MNNYIEIIIITSIVVGFATWLWTKASIEAKHSRKWTLGICHDTEIGWQPLLERHLDNRHWEYIYINKENLPLISHLAYSKVPSIPNPLLSKEDRSYKMIQDMVNRGHGQITGMKQQKE